MSDSEARSKVEEIVQNVHRGSYHHLVDNEGRIDIAPLLYFNEYEYTAFCQGIDLRVLATWRYEGWPDKCAKTGEKINYKEYGWLVKKIDGKTGLVLI